MNLLKETHRRLEYQYAKYADLRDCLEQPITNDCKHHINNQIKNTTDSIKYYSELLEVLETIKEDKKSE